MDCAACCYYTEGLQCKLHGTLKSLDRWLSCDDFIDASQRYIGGSCCGIYNFPTLSSPCGETKQEG